LRQAIPRDRTGLALGAFYFAWIAAIGAFGPFMASFLAARGLSPRAIAWLLAALPLVRVLVTPGWTFVADHLRAPGRVLQVVALGAALSFALLAIARSPLAVVAVVVAYTVFRAPIGALADTILLAWSQRTRTPFGRVRAWGSFGYLLAAFGAGATLERAGPSAAVALTLTLLAGAALFARALPEATPRPGASLWPAFVRMARDRRIARVLVAGVLQQMGLAPYDMLFPAWFAARAGGAWTGASIALGVACEVAVMLWARPWLARIGAERVMALSFAASVARWSVVAFSDSTLAIGLAQSLHALAFGTYFLASVELLDRIAPPEVRASAQGIQYTVVFGGGSALALSVAGALGGVVAVPTIFTVAAVCSALAALLMATARTEASGAAATARATTVHP
jgi:PPP family 3-phenylpropionic acid transporter